MQGLLRVAQQMDLEHQQNHKVIIATSATNNKILTKRDWREEVKCRFKECDDYVKIFASYVLKIKNLLFYHVSPACKAQAWSLVEK